MEQRAPDIVGIRRFNVTANLIRHYSTNNPGVRELKVIKRSFCDGLALYVMVVP